MGLVYPCNITIMLRLYLNFINFLILKLFILLAIIFKFSSYPTKFKYTEINSYPPLILSSSDALFVTFSYLNDSTPTPHLLMYVTHNGGKTWIPYSDTLKGNSKGISWRITNRAQRKLIVTYKNKAWTFDGDNWTINK